MKNLVWHSEVRKVRDLVINKDNPRIMDRKGLDSLKKKISSSGYHSGIVIDIDNTILSGNNSKRALEELNIEEVITIVPNRKLSDEEKQRVILESNIHEGIWQLDILKSSFNLEIINNIGFDDLTLDKLWEDKTEINMDDFDEEKELSKIKKPVTQLGDIIELGHHRIICGSSTEPKILKKLFGDKRASMIYSDPIYNIKIDYSKGIGGKQNYGGNVNDDRTPAEYKQFIKKSLDCALSVTKDDAHVIYWNDESQIGLIQQIFTECGVENKRVCLWIKNGTNPTPGVAFGKCYEPAMYGVRGKPYLNKSINNLNEVMNKEFTTGNDMFDQTMDHLDIWAVKRLPGQEYEHATSKPPSLYDKAIRRCTRPGDIILDSFLGSGSSLISAEKLGRIVYGVELETVFCDLIIRRFEQMTGIKAKIIHSDEKE